jgi:hypothetical protein
VSGDLPATGPVQTWLLVAFSVVRLAALSWTTGLDWPLTLTTYRQIGEPPSAAGRVQVMR